MVYLILFKLMFLEYFRIYNLNSEVSSKNELKHINQAVECGLLKVIALKTQTLENSELCVY